MAGNPPKDKLDPLHMAKTKHGIKVDKDGKLIIPKDLYNNFRPEDWEKGIEKKVSNHQAAFAASVLHSSEEAIVKHFEKNKKREEIKGKQVMAYPGNNLVIGVKRTKSFPMEGVDDKSGFATVGITQSFKTAVKPAREHLAELARKRKI